MKLTYSPHVTMLYFMTMEIDFQLNKHLKGLLYSPLIKTILCILAINCHSLEGSFILRTDNKTKRETCATRPNILDLSCFYQVRSLELQ